MGQKKFTVFSLSTCNGFVLFCRVGGVMAIVAAWLIMGSHQPVDAPDPEGALAWAETIAIPGLRAVAVERVQTLAAEKAELKTSSTPAANGEAPP